MAMGNGNKWLTPANDKEGEEIRKYARSFFDYLKNRNVNDSQITEDETMCLSREDSDAAQSSGTEKYFSADENSCNLENSDENNTLMICETTAGNNDTSKDNNDSEGLVRTRSKENCPVVYEHEEVSSVNESEDIDRTKRNGKISIIYGDTAEEAEINIVKKSEEINRVPRKQKSSILYVDEENNSDNETEEIDRVNGKQMNSMVCIDEEIEQVDRIKKSSKSSTACDKKNINTDEDSEEIGRNKRKQKSLILYVDEECNSDDETQEIDRVNGKQMNSTVCVDEEIEQVDWIKKSSKSSTVCDKKKINTDEDSEEIGRNRRQQKSSIEYIDTDDDLMELIKEEKNSGIIENNSKTRKNLISDEEESSEIEIIEENLEPVQKKKKFSKIEWTAKKKGTKNWWEEFNEPVPEIDQCKVKNCSFSSHEHRKHSIKMRVYSVYETKLIIAFLINNNLTSCGRSVEVWRNFTSQGYLTHRSIESLRNHFKRYIVKDIKLYQLPKHIEEQF